VSKQGTDELCYAIQEYLLELRRSVEEAAAQEAADQKIREETHAYSLRQREMRRAQRQQAQNQTENDDEDDDDDGVVVHYEP
jgi:hypothetical protein